MMGCAGLSDEAHRPFSPRGGVDVAGQALVLRIGATSKFGLTAVILLANAAQEAAPQSAYETCINNATAIYDASHAAECKRLADQTEQDRDNCLGKLKLTPSYCAASYPARDGLPNCTLPAENATVIDAALERARYRCARENGTGP
jgi:hypothetical protein